VGQMCCDAVHGVDWNLSLAKIPSALKMARFFLPHGVESLNSTMSVLEDR